MTDRYFCFLHRKPMTGVRIVHSGQPVHRCEDCVREAREKVHAQLAKYEAGKKATRANRFQCGRTT